MFDLAILSISLIQKHPLPLGVESVGRLRGVKRTLVTLANEVFFIFEVGGC